MAEVLVALIVGSLAGAVLTHVLVRRSALGEARARFEAWRAQDIGYLRRDAAARGRLRTKADVGLPLVGSLAGLPFAPADVRFLGDPVAFVVFDGHSAVKDGAVESLSGVVFVQAADPSGVLADTGPVAECVAGGRIGWETLVLDQSAAGTSSSFPVSTS